MAADQVTLVSTVPNQFAFAYAPQRIPCRPLSKTGWTSCAGQDSDLDVLPSSSKRAPFAHWLAAARNVEMSRKSGCLLE